MFTRVSDCGWLYQPAHWISCVSVEDVDATAKAATAKGGKVVEAPSDVPGVGRRARITDPQGAELYLFKNATGDPPDAPATPGRFFWNELHTSDPTKALAFYEKVLGFSHRSMDMGPGGTYHILSKGGVDRGGVTEPPARRSDAALAALRRRRRHRRDDRARQEARRDDPDEPRGHPTRRSYCRIRPARCSRS